MKMRKTIAILTAVCAVLAFGGVAMAQNRVEVKVTSEPIGYQATCDKAGGFSLEFDSNTVITVGDQITIDLDYKTPSVLTSICKSIDFEISAGGDAINAANAAANRWDLATIPVGATGPFYIVEDGTTAGDFAAGGDGVFFRVTGAANGQRITIDVMGTVGDTVTVGGDPGDKLILVILDQQSNAVFGTDGIYTPDPVTGVYDVEATAGDNTLCINVSQWDESTVDGNMDSSLDKYTFIPSNPQVAHIAAAVGIDFAYCAGKTAADPGRTVCGTVTENNGVFTDTCISFDYEDGTGYIPDTRAGSNRIIIQRTQPFILTEYQIRLEILVNGDTGDNGVYFSNQDLETAGFDTLNDACGAVVTSAGDAALADVPFATYLTAAGTVAAPAAPRDGGAPDCDVALGARAVYAETAATAFGALGIAGGGTNDFLLLDIPMFNYDLGVISADDVVSVRVTLIKAPCGTIFQGTRQVATMCAEDAPVIPPASRTIVYPYLTMASNDNWWDGIVITNLDAAEGHFTALVYEQDGDVGAFTGTIDANSLYQNTLEAAMTGATQVSGSGALGDSLCYMIVCVDFNADGFAFMGSTATNPLSSNESMGYVPRVTYDDGNITFCATLGVTAGDIPVFP